MDEKLKEALAKAADAGDFETELGFAEFFSSLKASGFAIVPIDATDLMRSDGLEALGGDSGLIASAWRAMIAAFEGE